MSNGCLPEQPGGRGCWMKLDKGEPRDMLGLAEPSLSAKRRLAVWGFSSSSTARLWWMQSDRTMEACVQSGCWDAGRSGEVKHALQIARTEDATRSRTAR